MKTLVVATLSTVLLGLGWGAVEPPPTEPTATATAEPTTPPTTEAPPPPTTEPSPPVVTPPPTTPPPTTPPPPADFSPPRVEVDCRHIKVSGPSNLAPIYQTDLITNGQAWPGPAGTTSVYAQMPLPQEQTVSWRVEVYAAGSGLIWSASGTKAACVDSFKGYVTPVRPALLNWCGARMSDVPIPKTTGITYTIDEWNLYAWLQPGYIWSDGTWGSAGAGYFGRGLSTTSDMAYLPRSSLIRTPAGCNDHYALQAPPFEESPNGTCWKYDPNKEPCPIPWSGYGPAPAWVSGGGSNGTTPRTAVGSPGGGGQPPPGTGPTDPKGGASPRATSAARSTRPAPSASPSSTPTTQVLASPPPGTTGGLALAHGITGASLLAAAGVIAIRLRRRPALSGILTHQLDENPPDET